MTIIYWTISWLAGIWLAYTWDLPNLFWLILCLPAILGATLLRKHAPWPILMICIAAAGLGAVRYNLATPEIDNTHIANHNDTKSVILTGVVTSEPQIRDNYIDLHLNIDTFQQENGTEIDSDGEILVRTARNPIIPYGARLRASGNLETPQNFGEFDYRDYLARQGLYTIMAFPDIEILDTDLGNPLVHLLLRIKARAQETINHLLPEPQAALLSGILLGNDDGLPEDLKEDFQETGMTHIIAISGFNIAVVAGILLIGSRYVLPFRTAAWVAIAGIAIYTIFVGADASVVRAAAMGILLIVATQIMGRPIFLPSTIFTAALVMTLINPHILWDVGFQLSFAATLGLALYIGRWSQIIENRLQPALTPNAAQRTTKLVTEVILATMAAMIMTLPIIIYHFGTLSIISPLANFLILPAQPSIMLWGGLSTILGMISPLLGQVPAWIAWLFLIYTTSLVRFFASLSVTTIPMSLSFGSVTTTYALILGITWLSGQESEKKEQLFGRTRKARLLRGGLAAIYDRCDPACHLGQREA